LIDPRTRSAEPGPEEVEAWAARERARRAAWLGGPSGEERQEWARGQRWRAALGLAESRLGPTAEEAEAWAERERKRREAWLSGPTEEEKREWARGDRRRARLGFSDSRLPPTTEEVEAWARREQQRRRDWSAGPNEDEKREWARRQALGGLWEELVRWPLPGAFLPEAAQRLLREAELAGKGSLYSLAGAPAALWSYFVRAGRVFEQEFYQPARRGRVPY
jgi:hypothetical protein